MSIQRVLILGAKGTLGGQLMKLYPEAVGWDREDIDVLDFPALRAKVEDLRPAPDAIVNCVAFNDVDGAEDRPDAAMALNGWLPQWLAQFTAELGVPLVHYSTNYVFDGAQGEYGEADSAGAALRLRALQALRGEQLIAEAGGQCYIVRTAVIIRTEGRERPLQEELRGSHAGSLRQARHDSGRIG